MKKKPTRRKKRTPGEEPIIEGQVGVTPVTAQDLGLPPMTDSGNAELIAALYGEILRFDHRQSRWLIWDKNRNQWSEDDSCTIRMFALKAARRRRQLVVRISDKDEAAREFRWTYESESRYRLDAALEIAKSLPPVSDSGGGWDADPWLFGVANGVIDLRTGELREETQQDRITKHSPIEYATAAECPRFLTFHCEICNYDAELSWYHWKVAGYLLTGLTSEQVLFCLYGLGANGKTTLAETYRHVLGDYAANLPFSALELKNRNSNDLVALACARFVTAAETNEGVRLNEARVKSLTGGDPITARRLYREFFTFSPTHKLWLSFNHKPVIADDSEGMWRRVHLIPFTQQFKPEEQDKGLLDALKAEASGILTWMVQGCLRWQQEGLGMPPAVAEATSLYREESDHIGEFIEDCCTVEPSATVLSGSLWQRYKQWAKENEEISLTRPVFTERLKRRGVTPDRLPIHGGPRGWVGIALRGETVTQDGTNSESFPIEPRVRESLHKSVSPSDTASPCPQNPSKSDAIRAVRKAGDAEGDTEKRVLEVEI